MLDKIILRIEHFCKINKINHRFVGGVSFGGLINSKTTWKIDVRKKIVYLKNYNDLSIKRRDGSIRDIDIIILTSDINKINKLKYYLSSLRKEFLPYPSISVESLIRKTQQNKTFIPQFVSALVIDEDKNLYFSFENIRQKISLESLDAWTVSLKKDIQYTVRNPIADHFAYQFRLPSGIKPKDKGKVILLERLSKDVLSTGKKARINYLSDNYYGSWVMYIDKLRNAKSISIQIKKGILKAYGNTIGTYFGHEKGLLGKLFAPLSNQFTGTRQ